MRDKKKGSPPPAKRLCKKLKNQQPANVAPKQPNQQSAHVTPKQPNQQSAHVAPNPEAPNQEAPNPEDCVRNGIRQSIRLSVRTFKVASTQPGVIVFRRLYLECTWL